MKPHLLLFGFLASLIFPVSALADQARIGYFDDAVAAIDSARRSITVSAYTLNPVSQRRFLEHLEDAANRGVHVHLVLSGEGFGYAVSQNREIAVELRSVRVELLQRPIHLKAIVVDSGRVV